MLHLRNCVNENVVLFLEDKKVSWLFVKTKLKQQRRQRRLQREWQKTKRFRLAKLYNNSARAPRFFVHFFAVTARLRRETA